MIGLDTNVVVRYLTQDDPKQAAAATRFLEKSLSAEEPGFISLIVLVEIVWVLVSCYSMERVRVLAVIEGLLTTAQLRVESAELVWKALRRYSSSKADFSDALVTECAVAAGCRRIVTFDRAAAAGGGMEMMS